MGIIGVVAALTLPNLNSSTGDKEKVAKVKKIYSNLEDAWGRATAVYGPVDEWFANDTTDDAKNKRFAERLTEFLKVSKNCGTSTGCFTNGNIGGAPNSGQAFGSVHICNKNINSLTSFYKIILADGTSLGFDKKNDMILIDIDGPSQGRYQYARDVFELPFDEKTGFYNDFDDFLPECFDTALSCWYWIINYGNMDYLKVNEQGKCPDGKTVLDGVSNITCK
ncbi:hypothetical protein IJ843_04300 [bacterium]|nr:hypothetical protein [bacterium]